MNEHFWWYVARATGITAWVAVIAAVLWGTALATKTLGRNPKPAWLADLHRHLGGLSVVLTGVHLAALVFDNYVHFGPRELFVPMASGWRPGAVTWGVAAFYLLVVIEVSSLVMRRLPRALWRSLHLLSYPLAVVSTVHLFAAGTDADHPAFGWSVVGVVAVLSMFVLYRELFTKPSRVPARSST